MFTHQPFHPRTYSLRAGEASGLAEVTNDVISDGLTAIERLIYYNSVYSALSHSEDVC